MMEINQIEIEKTAFQTFFVLEKIKKIKIKKNQKEFLEDVDFVQEFLCLILADNNNLKKSVFDMEHRIQVLDWAFGGIR
jgi:hypothetical protein